VFITEISSDKNRARRSVSKILIEPGSDEHVIYKLNHSIDRQKAVRVMQPGVVMNLGWLGISAQRESSCMEVWLRLDMGAIVTGRGQRIHANTAVQPSDEPLCGTRQDAGELSWWLNGLLCSISGRDWWIHRAAWLFSVRERFFFTSAGNIR